MRYSLLFLSCCLIAPISGFAQLPPSQECYLIREMARTTAGFRALGVAKQQILDDMQAVRYEVLSPEWSQRMVAEAYELIDEVYAYGAIEPTVYGGYREGLCLILRSGGELEVPFEEAYLDLLTCGRLESEVERRECGKGVADSYASAA